MGEGIACVIIVWDLLRLWKSSLERGNYNPSAEDFPISSLLFASSLDSFSPPLVRARWLADCPAPNGDLIWHDHTVCTILYWTIWPRDNLWIYVIAVFRLEGHDWNTLTNINSSSFSPLGSYIFKITQEHMGWVTKAQSLKAACY